MKRVVSTFVAFIASVLIAQAQIKILFDATKAETAGNADWVIDADAFNLGFSTGPAVLNGGSEANPQRYPTPLQSTVTTSTTETYWTGGLSAWGIDCVKKGYQVETLPYNGTISYGNTSNVQDLANYKIFVVVEPNILFTAAEKTAIMNFVKNGGSLFMVSDHTISDRNNDGYDSPAIWNDLLTNNTVQNNPFGFTFDLANVSPSSTNISTYAKDSLLHGDYGNVSQVLWSNGTTITINPTVNASVKAAVYNTGSSNTGNTGVLVAYARYGLGKVVAVGDSSPFDDGTGDSGDALYTGYTGDANGNHRVLIMNATVWLATTTVLPVTFTNISCTPSTQTKAVTINWATANEVNTQYFNIQKSSNGIDFSTISTVPSSSLGNYTSIDNSIANTNIAYYKIECVDKDGARQYSKTVSVSFAHTNAFSFYPNPAKAVIAIECYQPTTFSIINAQGKKLATFYAASTTYFNTSTLKPGLYLLQAKDSNGTITTKQLLKN